jgi:hypothetical protein
VCSTFFLVICGMGREQPRGYWAESKKHTREGERAGQEWVHEYERASGCASELGRDREGGRETERGRERERERERGIKREGEREKEKERERERESRTQTDRAHKVQRVLYGRHAGGVSTPLVVCVY